MKAPRFWYQKKGKLATLLSPLGRLYGWSVARRIQRACPYQVDIPVICVGNLSVGGTGKTPVCLALGAILAQHKVPYFFLNHGYKSKQQNVLVDAKTTALDVGDEAMLLAEQAPTVVDHHRVRGAQKAVQKGAKALIMDDGFQNPNLIKTISFLVVDGKQGFGNQCLLPAGPLREPVERGLKRADVVIIAGTDTAGVQDLVRKLDPDMPILHGSFQPDPALIKSLKGKKATAFAGIGQPDKFFHMLEQAGIELIAKIPFPDHCFYTRFDIEQLLADAQGLPLLTTTKDYVKIPKDIQGKITVVRGHFVFNEPEKIENILKGILK